MDQTENYENTSEDCTQKMKNENNEISVSLTTQK